MVKHSIGKYLTKFEIEISLHWQKFLMVSFSDVHEMIICLDFGSENQGGIARISDEEMFPKCLKSLCVVLKILSPDIVKLSLLIFSIFSALLSARNASDVVVFNSRFPVDWRWFLKQVTNLSSEFFSWVLGNGMGSWKVTSCSWL